MSRENTNFDFDRAYRIIAVGFKLGGNIVQSSRETREKCGTTPTSGLGVAHDRVDAVRNWPFSLSV